MTRAVLTALLALGSCTPRAGAPPADPASTPAASRAFDAAAWLVRARPAAFEMGETGYDDPRADPAKALAAELDAAAGWARACDSRWDRQTQRFVDDPSASFSRGLFTLTDVGPAEAVVAVTCNVAAYQGSYALVHVVGGRAVLLAGQRVDPDGVPFGPPVPVHPTPTLTPGSRRFTTVGLSRGLGDCGIRSAYEITAPGTATLVEARGRDCDGDDAPPPEAWPIVFPR